MAEQVGHLLEADTVAMQAGRRGMPQDMGSRPLGTTLNLGEGEADPAPDQLRPDSRPYWHGMTDEEPPAASRRSAVTEILCDRSPDPFGQRQYPRPPRLAALNPQGGRRTSRQSSRRSVLTSLTRRPRST